MCGSSKPYWGVSGSDKTDETENPNQTKAKSIRSCLVQFKIEPNQRKPS